VVFFDSLQPMSFLWWVGVLELVGGLLVLLGLLTRPAAFILSGQMAFAYFIGHASQGHVLSPMEDLRRKPGLAPDPGLCGAAYRRVSRVSPSLRAGSPETAQTRT